MKTLLLTSLILFASCAKPKRVYLDQATPPKYEEFNPPPPEIADEVDQFGEQTPKKVKKNAKKRR